MECSWTRVEGRGFDEAGHPVPGDVELAVGAVVHHQVLHQVGALERGRRRQRVGEHRAPAPRAVEGLDDDAPVTGRGQDPLPRGDHRPVRCRCARPADRVVQGCAVADARDARPGIAQRRPRLRQCREQNVGGAGQAAVHDEVRVVQVRGSDVLLVRQQHATADAPGLEGRHDVGEDRRGSGPLTGEDGDAGLHHPIAPRPDEGLLIHSWQQSSHGFWPARAGQNPWKLLLLVGQSLRRPAESSTWLCRGRQASAAASVSSTPASAVAPTSTAPRASNG